MAPPVISCAVISCNSRSRFDDNIPKVFDLVRQAVSSKATDWVSVPEVFDFVGAPLDVEGVWASRHDWLVGELSKLARELRVVLFAGSIHEPSGLATEKRSYNTSYVFDREGKTIGKYRKIHLFELHSTDGNVIHSEADNFLAGDKVSVIEVDGFRIGLTICYDVRFPGLYERLLRIGKPDVLMVPAAFTKLTGMAHWELLIRARAVEYQSYVIAANQTGSHGVGKESFGHSMIVDPWGEKLCDSGEIPGFCHAQIDLSKISEVRARLPVFKNRRVELYY